MPSLSDSIFLFILALLLFGPKKLPVLAREIGKWVGEFRRASNEFKMQMEDELRQSEQADRLKKIEAMEAAAPPVPELPKLPGPGEASGEFAPGEPEISTTPLMSHDAAHDGDTSNTEANDVLPIAEAGELKIMPPSTGLPTARRSALGGLLDSIPAAKTNGTSADAETVETTHGS